MTWLTNKFAGLLLCMTNFFCFAVPLNAQETTSLTVHDSAQQSTQKSAQQNIESKIEQVIENYSAKNAFAGTVLVAKSGRIVFEAAYGLSDIENKQSTKITSAFQLASLSKPITATLVLKLVELGKLSLTSTLSDHFTEFNTPFGKSVAIHHLLSHTSGIPDHFAIDGWVDVNFHQNTSPQKFVKIIAQLPPKSKPGENYLYSNPGYFLLGKIIEKVTEASYASNLQKHILSPLKMENSGVADGFNLPTKSVKGYRWNNEGGYRQQTAKNMDLFGAGSAIYSSVRDLYQFDKALYGSTLITETSKKQLFDPKTAYSWRVGKVSVTPNKTTNVHMYDGQFDGYSSLMTRFIDEQHSIIILTNTGMSYFLKQQLTFDLAAILYNHQPKNRQEDTSLMLIDSLAKGSFEQTLKNMSPLIDAHTTSEASLTALAYQMLWSGLGDKSLQLFAWINKAYEESSQAVQNLKKSCNHPLTAKAKSRVEICGK